MPVVKGQPPHERPHAPILDIVGPWVPLRATPCRGFGLDEFGRLLGLEDDGGVGADAGRVAPVAYVGVDKLLLDGVRQRAAQADVDIQQGSLAAPLHDPVACLPDMPGLEVFEPHAADDGSNVPAVTPVGFVDPRLDHGPLVLVKPPAEPVIQQWKLAGPDPPYPLVFGQRGLEFSPRPASEAVVFVEPAPLTVVGVSWQFAAEMPVAPPVPYDRYTHAGSGKPYRCSHPSTSVCTLTCTHLARKVPNSGEISLSQVQSWPLQVGGKSNENDGISTIIVERATGIEPA